MTHLQNWKKHLQPHYLDPFVGPMMDDLLAKISLENFPEKNAPPHLLDFGCGTGEKANAFQKIGFQAVGIDINSEYVAAARQQFPAVEFHCSDAQVLPFADDSFDVVHSFSVLQYVEHQQVINEMRRVLRPGGRLILIENLGNNLFTKTYRWLHRLAGLRYTAYQNPRGYLQWRDLPSLGKNFSTWEFAARHIATPFSLVPSELKSRVLQGSGCFYPPPGWLFRGLSALDRAFFSAEKWHSNCWFVQVYGEK